MVLQDSFEIHKELNPKLWGRDNRLLPEVEEKIKDTVDLFINSVDLPLRIVDIHIVGSNASFNYTDNSDLDVHIVINYSNMDASPQLVEILMNSLRSSFNSKHDIKIHGISLELFVEDVRSGITSNGIYSVFMKRWIKFPKRLTDIPNIDVSDDLEKWERKIDAVLDREDKDEVQQTIDRLYLIRKNSIAKDGEYGYGNQLFKEIRNSGKLGELKDLLTELESKYLSLENYTNNLTEDIAINDPESGETVVQKEPEDSINEKSRMALLNQSKSSQKGMERYKKRTKSKLAATVKQFNSIDMNKLFKDDIFTIDISVKGETDEYVVRISYGGFLEILHDQLRAEKKDQVDLKMITRALIIGFNRGDVYIHCNCPDACLHEDTKIKLLNGITVTVKEMLEKFEKGEDLWVYSTDESGDFAPGHISNVWVSKKTNQLVKITLDNDKEIITTPDHRYMLRDGSYEEAQNLSIGQSLMPLYFRQNNGYESVKCNSEPYPTKYYSVYKTVADKLLQEQIQEAKDRTGEEVIQIHHKDFNKLNNLPSNLYPMGQLEHWMYHASHVKESGQLEKFLKAGEEYWRTPEAKEKQAEVMRENTRKYVESHSKEERVQHLKDCGVYGGEWKKTISESHKKLWENMSDEEYSNRCEINQKTNNNPEVKKKISTAQKKNYQENPHRVEISKDNLTMAWKSVKGIPFTEDHKNKISEARNNFSEEKWNEINAKIRETQSKKSPEELQKQYDNVKYSRVKWVVEKVLSCGLPLTFDNYNKYKRNGDPRLDKLFVSEKDALKYFGIEDTYNHKIKSIEFIETEKQVPVYDIQVDDYNNFYVDAGVVLHNCYRMDYWQTRKGINSGKPQNIPSKITNPDDTLGSACKHTLLVLSNTSWLLKCASTIWNYINYMKDHYQKLYQTVIYPAIYGKEYEEPIQLDIFDDDTLETDKDTIDKSNQYGKDRTKFQKGNTKGVRFAPGEDKNQIKLDLDDQVEETT